MTQRRSPDHTADPGLFGPDSVTWQLHADPVMWVAGVRALYLQALHPRAVQGVIQNSDFRKDPWGRLIRTADFIGVTTYGTREAAQGAGAHVRRIHDVLRATDPATGEVYRIDEPELLLWIHCAEVASYLDVVRRAGFPLTDADADRYYDEQRTAAALVGLDPADVPGDTAAMRDYFAAVRPELAAGDGAQDVWDFLRRPPVPAVLWPARELVWRRIADLAYGSLPGWARMLYGHGALPPFAVTGGLRAARGGLGLVTPVIRAILPSPHIKEAVGRLGPEAEPSPSRLTRR